MRKLPTSLYAANRELRAMLRDYDEGVSETILKHATKHISTLSDVDYTALLDYIRGTNVVWFHYENGELLLSLHQQAGCFVVYDPIARTAFDVPKMESVTKEETKGPETHSETFKVNDYPMFYHSHKPPTKLDTRAFVAEVDGILDYLRLPALEVVAVVSYIPFGATMSEVARRIPSYERLSGSDKHYLFEWLDENSKSFLYIPADSVSNRADGTMILIHRKFLPATMVDGFSGVAVTTDDSPTNPLAEQLGALKSKLVFKSEKTITPLKQVGMASCPPAKPEPLPESVTTPLISEQEMQQPEEPNLLTHPQLTLLNRLLESYDNMQAQLDLLRKTTEDIINGLTQ